ncbi:MAG: SIS domain-containing protein [Candidatus Thermoplasmatota archaeon]|nr:SIS domain-containing protein [Candidatus Thermoplasmatota archaeon]MBS3789570.1 SIS domain-containing protein [Candidatus Thermoplasmatota archaeon]
MLVDSVEHILDSIEYSFENLNCESIEETVEILTASNNIFVYGSGRSGLVGRTFAMRLMQLGLDSFFIGETITPAVKPGNCVFFVSKTGETQTAIQAAEIVKSRVNESNIIVLTASPESTLAGLGDVVIFLEGFGSEKNKKLAPLGTLFEDTAMIFLDGLIAVLMDELGEYEEDMKVRHPILI